MNGRLNSIQIELFLVSWILLAIPLTLIAGPQRVEVCHVAPGNGAKFHTIRIVENRLESHLAHGDLANACNEFCAELCDDGDACTVDDTGDCADQGCPLGSEPVNCDDLNLCTVDSCDSASGCINDPITCTPPDLCTSSVCDPLTGSCQNTPILCDPGEECNLATGQCVTAPCVEIGQHCVAGSPILETICGYGLHTLSFTSASNISYVELTGPVNSIVMHHCIDDSDFSGATLEVINDTNLCSLPGGCCSTNRWSDSVCAIEIK